MSTQKQNKVSSYLDKMVIARRKTLEQINGLDFRYEHVGMFNGCTIVNNSRSASIESIVSSLKVTKTPTHLIVGSIDVPTLLEFAEREIRLKVVMLGVYGQHDLTQNHTLSRLVDQAIYHEKLDDVVLHMMVKVKAGETLLFSPGTLDSYTYENFTQRGMHFNKLVTEFIK